MKQKIIPYLPGLIAIVCGLWGIAPSPEGCYDCGMAKGIIVSVLLVATCVWGLVNAFLFRANFLRVLLINLICVVAAIGALVLADSAV